MVKEIISRLLPALVAALPGLLAVSCQEDMTFSPTRPDMTQGTGHSISSFSVDTSHFKIPEDVDSVGIALISPDGKTQCFGAGVNHEGKTVRFNMTVPDTVSISDGKYILTLRNASGGSIPGRLSARFKSHLLSSVEIILPAYMLDGEGTEENPYLITNDDDFSMFLINLADDTDSYGAGLKFLQTADVTAPDQSSLIPGRGYWGAPFAGIYDGGGHTIRNLYYRGAGREDSDSGIGLFTSLLGTASVQDLSLKEVAVSGIYKSAGAIAGSTSGDVSLTRVSAGGYLEDGYAIGGLVGIVGSGTLTVKDSELRISVKGTNDVGGVAGRVDGEATLNVSGLRTPDTHFSVEGNKSVGGVIGRVTGFVNLSDIILDHKVSGEDSDIRIIKGNVEGAGGLVGTVTSDAHTQKYSGCRILCPVGGTGSNIGGIAGQIFMKNAMELTDCRVYSVVSGERCTGGIIGKADLGSGARGVVIKGEDYSTRISADEADAKVEGLDYTGGFAGWWHGPLTLESKVRINVPVSGEKSVGGAFGGLISSSVAVTSFQIGQYALSQTANTLRIKGAGRVGGVAGYIEKSTLSGESRFDFSEAGKPVNVPEASRFTAVVDCVVTGEDAVGGIAGYAQDSKLLYLCSAASVSGSSEVGGIAGCFVETGSNTNIEDCTFKGTLECTAASAVGGIVGYYESQNAGVVHDCVNYSPIRGGDSTGGIIGRLERKLPKKDNPAVEVKWCVNVAPVDGEHHIGGIIGWHSLDADLPSLGYTDANFFLNNCMNSGVITGRSTSASSSGIGGIIGYTSALIDMRYCANHGSVTGSGPFHGIGGVAGSVGSDPPGALITTSYRNVDVKECVNTATVDARDASSYVGGVIGYQEEGHKSDLGDLHNLGAVPCKQNHDSGGIVGCVDHDTNIRRAINVGKVSHGNATIGTHKSGSLFQHEALYFLEGTGKNWPGAKSIDEVEFDNCLAFEGLHFNTVWCQDEGKYYDYYPSLTRCAWKVPPGY